MSSEHKCNLIVEHLPSDLHALIIPCTLVFAWILRAKTHTQQQLMAQKLLVYNSECFSALKWYCIFVLVCFFEIFTNNYSGFFSITMYWWQVIFSGTPTPLSPLFLTALVAFIILYFVCNFFIKHPFHLFWQEPRLLSVCPAKSKHHCAPPLTRTDRTFFFVLRRALVKSGVWIFTAKSIQILKWEYAIVSHSIAMRYSSYLLWLWLDALEILTII